MLTKEHYNIKNKNITVTMIIIYEISLKFVQYLNAIEFFHIPVSLILTSKFKKILNVCSDKNSLK